MNDLNIFFVEFSLHYLNKSWEWLNDPEIKNLTNTHDFSREQQLKFYQSLPNRNDYSIYGVEVNGLPVGVCGLKNITSVDAEYWGYIGEKKYWGKGIGRKMMEYCIDWAKEKSLSSIYLTVIESNKRAINLYEKYQFKKEESENNNLIKMRLKLI